MRRLLRHFLPVAVMLLVWCGTVGAQGTLPTSSGPAVTDVMLREMIDNYVPEHHSTILIFSQCFGGNFLAPFAGRPDTVAMSASSPNAYSYYGGFHDDAARAMGPAEGKTSHDIFASGVAGSSDRESPLIHGDAVPFTPVDPNGEIRSRHVLVYASQPARLDHRDYHVINDLMADEQNTTVTLVGGAFRGRTDFNGFSWEPDYPDTATGLAEALAEIGEQMGKDEQFVMFVTDHGGRLPITDTFTLGPAGSPQATHNFTLALTPQEVEFMNSDASELGKLAFLLFLPDAEEAPDVQDLEISLDLQTDIPASAVYSTQFPPMFGFGGLSLGHTVEFQLEPELVATNIDMAGVLNIWLFHEAFETHENATGGLGLPFMPMFGVDDMFGIILLGTESPDSFTDDTGDQPVFQFAISNESETEAMGVSSFDFDVAVAFDDPTFVDRIAGYDVYQDYDGDGRLSEDDRLLGYATQVGAGSYTVQNLYSFILEPLTTTRILVVVKLE